MSDETSTAQPSRAPPSTASEATSIENNMETAEISKSSVPEQNGVVRLSEVVSDPDDPTHEHDEASDAQEDENDGTSFNQFY